MDVTSHNLVDMKKQVDKVVTDPNWNEVFKNAFDDSKGHADWHFNIKGLAKNMQLKKSDVAYWHEHYGLWPGRVLALFAGYSRWVHLSSNTLPFYNVFPLL